jgi:hypothetical protein
MSIGYKRSGTFATFVFDGTHKHVHACVRPTKDRLQGTASAPYLTGGRPG